MSLDAPTSNIRRIKAMAKGKDFHAFAKAQPLRVLRIDELHKRKRMEP
jgi:hypothetical protein